MAELGSFTFPTLFTVLLLLSAALDGTCNPVNISLRSVPESLIHTAINSLNRNSPTQNTYRGGNLISAQKLLEPSFVIYRLTLNLQTICSEGSTSCPREACTIDLKDTSGQVEVDPNTIQCLYLYPQSTQEDIQQSQQQQNSPGTDSDFHKSTLDLDHEVQAAAELQKPDTESAEPFIAVKAENSNYCAGCPYELNPNLPGLNAFVTQALDAMDRLRQNEHTHKFIRMLKVTRAVPPSSTAVEYKLLAEIGESNCLNDAVTERSLCSLRSDSPSRWCLITFQERPWIQGDRQITGNNCTARSDDENEVNAVSDTIIWNPGNTEGVLSGENIFETKGLQVLRDPDELHELQKEDSAQVLNQERPAVTEAPIVRVELERPDNGQKVQGFVDKQKEFEEFLEGFDIPLRTETAVVDDHEDGRQPVTEEIIRPEKVDRLMVNSSSDLESNFNESVEDALPDLRQERANINRNKRNVGSATSISTNDENVKNFTAMGFQKFLETYQGQNEPLLLNVTSATKQIVQGSLYKMTVKIGVSDCPKGTKNNCQLQAGSEPQTCEISAWSRPWLSTDKLKITVTCQPNTNLRKKRSAVMGAVQPISIDDPEVKNYANLGVSKFSENLGGQNEHMLIEIMSATRQVVQGSQYIINVRLGESDCPKGTKNNCQLKAGSQPQECEVKVWSRPWLKSGALDVQVNCKANERAKRSLRGKDYSKKMLEQSTYLRNERLFNDFVDKYNKSYESLSDRKYRFKVFQLNMMTVQELQRNEQGTAIYGASMFADLTTQEFKRYLGLKPELRVENEIPIPMAEIPNVMLPESFDWRDHNVVTPVKNQGSCGSCWAFSVTGNIEGQYALRHGNLLSFSEQELVDCDTLDEGCGGGLPDNAYRAIEKIGGLELESDYPYDGANEVCHFNTSEVRAKVVSAVNITSNETQMAQWLVKNGPISIGINANAMQFYMGGISHPYKFLCSPTNLDHGVLIVGYGIHTYPIFHKTLPYWTIKNSWGPQWGEKGYYRVYRGDGTCGVNQMASSAVVA
ncbi:uncharacterized protein LOC124186837 [Neodiprion fabricii]|uniref:uncharacterized protein LOC124186837 n=1 Tax=Neodiprion fabricii TaxID=2872261 RepID=UPI001ED8EA3D|nr:uncharacterized protein LOC124186837 [Neodiprion fabricii]